MWKIFENGRGKGQSWKRNCMELTLPMAVSHVMAIKASASGRCS